MKVVGEGLFNKANKTCTETWGKGERRRAATWLSGRKSNPTRAAGAGTPGDRGRVLGEGKEERKAPWLGLRSDGESGGRAGSCRWERSLSARCSDRAEGRSASPSPGQVCWCQDRDAEGLRLLGGAATWAGALGLRNWASRRRRTR